MPFAPLKFGERKLLIAAFIAACLIGSLAGYAAYLEEAEAQFHGGVLEEDRAEAESALIWEPTSAFARWTVGIVLIFGVAPIAGRRLFGGRSA